MSGGSNFPQSSTRILGQEIRSIPFSANLQILPQDATIDPIDRPSGHGTVPGQDRGTTAASPFAVRRVDVNSRAFTNDRFCCWDPNAPHNAIEADGMAAFYNPVR